MKQQKQNSKGIFTLVEKASKATNGHKGNGTEIRGARQGARQGSVT